MYRKKRIILSLISVFNMSLRMTKGNFSCTQKNILFTKNFGENLYCSKSSTLICN